MRINALAVANYFVDKANEDREKEGEDSVSLDLLKLVKLTYIAYGFTLAGTDVNVLDPDYDMVQAWDLGPVIPTVYKAFRHNGRRQITKKERRIIHSPSAFQ